jgi:hypothetical protein
MLRLLSALCLAVTVSASTPLPLKLEKGAHVVLVGNTLIERMQEHAWFEKIQSDRLIVRKELAFAATASFHPPR